RNTQFTPQEDSGSHKPRAISSLLFVFDIATDDPADVGVLFLGLLDEGRVVVVIALHLLDLDVVTRLVGWLLGALGLRIRLLERDEFGLLRLRGLRLGRRGARRGCVRAAARRDDSDLVDRAALRAGDRILVEVVELCAATGAEALSTELWLCHG